MADILWREGWLKPLSTESLPNDSCAICKEEFKNLDYVTSCEFCEIGLSHESCCNNHSIKSHIEQIKAKIEAHKEKRLHSYQ
ncbi:hypothetical protein [Candidatus Nitrosocosmicus hydrocola]|uniref:hypothetical protein n=1 Tax=Candidatus Nitrosocosmicus hydrocola TaxID=1826872 RepID=UPI0011E58997|nr:hypothetical protein [Candidatus Nitrosocosmicus hydrocola]